MNGGGYSVVDGGYDTARVSTAEADQQRRADRDAAATRYLVRMGNEDLLPILGLAPEPCCNCGQPISTPGSKGFCDTRTCQAAANRRAKAGGER